MKKGRGDEKSQRDEELEKALAALICSTHSKRRPFSLTEIAGWLELAREKLGGYRLVAERIGVSTKMLRQFSYMGRLSKTVQRLFSQRTLDSVDAAAHLAMLPLQEQEAVAREIVAGKIDSIDVRAVVQLRRITKGAPIAEILKRVKASKTRQQYVVEFIVRGTRDRRRLLDELGAYMPVSEIVRLDLDGAFGRLVLTAAGKRHLFATAKKLGCPAKQVIPTLLSS